jgi:hypothetical protein
LTFQPKLGLQSQRIVKGLKKGPVFSKEWENSIKKQQFSKEAEISYKKA